jgi:hypothetical protein
MRGEFEESNLNRVSVWVVEAGVDEPSSMSSAAYADDPAPRARELAVLTQQSREDALQFAERVTTKVARLQRTHSAPERLALVLQDDVTQSLTGAHSEALGTVALHLMQAPMPLTIRIASDE